MYIAHWLLYQDRKQLFSVQVWEVVRQKPPVRGGCEEEGKEVEEEEDKEEERGKEEEEQKEEGKEEEEDEKETPVRLRSDAPLPLGGRSLTACQYKLADSSFSDLFENGRWGRC